MNCPGHIQVFKQGLRSLPRAPLRLAEFGKVHRYEPSGRCTVSGFGPSRKMTPTFFCTPDQITAEAVKVTEWISHLPRLSLRRRCGSMFSDRPPKRVGSDEIWDNARAAARQAPRLQGSKPR